MRVANSAKYSPDDVETVAHEIRKILGSRENASHFRIASEAFEFNMFARDSIQLQAQKEKLEKSGFIIKTVKLLDTPPVELSREDALAQGVQLFNEERFWESHEILEQVWRVSTGNEKDTLQSLILTAAAFVHYQKGEPEICLSVLGRARKKLSSNAVLPRLDVEMLRKRIDRILGSKKIRLFKLQKSRC